MVPEQLEPPWELEHDRSVDWQMPKSGRDEDAIEDKKGKE